MAQARGGSARVGIGQDRGDDRYARAAGSEHRVKVVGGDATDGQHRNLDLVDDGLELGQAAWRHAWMGSGRKDMAEREVLRALLGCLGCLV